jgi:hypothetical protein
MRKLRQGLPEGTRSIGEDFASQADPVWSSLGWLAEEAATSAKFRNRRIENRTLVK